MQHRHTNPGSQLIVNMASDLMQIEIIWKEVPTTCDPCIGCNDIIYGKQYQMFTLIAGKEQSNDAVICGSCFEEIQNDGD